MSKNSRHTQADKRIRQFADKGTGYRSFLYLAAQPLLFSTDLLYKLWLNFSTYAASDDAPCRSYLVVSDLILSGICRPVGVNLFSLDDDIREQLHKQLDTDNRKAVAKFVYEYAEHNKTRLSKNIYDVHRIWAMGVIAPFKMEKEIKEKITGEASSDYEKVNYLSLYFNSMPLDEEGEQKTNITLQVAESVHEENVLNVRLPLNLRNRINLSNISLETTELSGTELALSLIEKERHTKTGYLELGRCELRSRSPRLQEVWDALSELIHLETLILSDEWIDRVEGRIKRSRNKGGKNLLDKIPKAIANMTSLERLVIAGGGDSWNIEKLENLPQNLSILNIHSNRISTLENLPPNISILGISSNGIAKLENLPETLSELYINYNRISILENLPRNLNQFEIRSNDIKELKPLLPLIKKGIDCDVRNNLIESPLREIVEQGTDAILSYFEKLETEDKSNIQDEVLVQSSFNAILDLNSEIDISTTRNIFVPKRPVQTLDLLSSTNGKITSLLVTLPYKYLKKDDEPYLSYLNVVGELAEKFDNTQLVLLAEAENEQLNEKEQKKIDEIKSRLRNNSRILVSCVRKADDNAFSIWSQDAFLIANPKNNPTPNLKYLINPTSHRRNNRRNDSSIVKGMIAEPTLGYTPLNFPTPLEGGNVLVADDFILVGQDEVIHSQMTNAGFLKKFQSFFGDEKPLIPISVKHTKARKPIESPTYSGELEVTTSKSKTLYYHDVYRWRGKEQPLFHLDLFITLLGRNVEGKQLIMVGEPVAGFELSGLNSNTRQLFDYQFNDVKERITECLQNFERDLTKNEIEYEILRNPLPLTYYRHGFDTSWYWASYNNCLVEITPTQKTVWLPSYGTHINSQNLHWNYLKKYDEQQVDLLQKNGFKVHLFNQDFHFLASKSGSLRSMTKCLDRS